MRAVCQDTRLDDGAKALGHCPEGPRGSSKSESLAQCVDTGNCKRLPGTVSDSASLPVSDERIVKDVLAPSRGEDQTGVERGAWRAVAD